MPRLLKNKTVQLHMPRTGGHSLAHQVGTLAIHGTIHSVEIPQDWKEYRKVATFRNPGSWYKSMEKYIGQRCEKKHMIFFKNYEPGDANNHILDPTFGLWTDHKNHFKKFLASGSYQSWYEAYTDYFLGPADQIIPISKLRKHIK